MPKKSVVGNEVKAEATITLLGWRGGDKAHGLDLHPVSGFLAILQFVLKPSERLLIVTRFVSIY